jgi:hypothetical protein
MLLRCTKKLINTYDIAISNETSSENILNEWYANLIYMDRKKCILFTQSTTLFNIFLPNVKKADIGNIGEIFKSQLENSLNNLNIPSKKINLYIDYLNGMKFSETKSRSVLGSMKEYTQYYKIGIAQAGGLGRCDIDKLIYGSNSMIMGALDYRSGNEEIKEALSKLK